MKHKLPVDKSVTFRIQDDLLLLFDKTADEKELSRSQYIRKLILRELHSRQNEVPVRSLTFVPNPSDKNFLINRK